MSDFLSESQRLISGWRLKANSHPQATYIEVRLHQAARLVSAAHFGADLFENPTIHEPTAAMVLVFASGQTSIDLCATALLRWHGDLPPEGQEWSFSQLRKKASTLKLSDAQEAWYHELTTSAEAADLTDFRHAIVHRVVRMDATVRPGPTPNTVTISPSTSSAGTGNAALTLRRTASYVEDRWREFVAALLSS
jgi:hypothetical protein